MRDSTNPYSFRDIVSSDLQLLSSWQKEPKVLRWFGAPESVEDLEDKLEDSRIRIQLVLYNDEPIAYVQDYDIHKWTNHHLAYLPPDSRGIDTFIGSDRWMGKGHGTKYLSLLCQMYFGDGVPAMGIDPDPENVLARHVYEKIGFREDGVVDSEWGKVLTMSLYSPMAR